MIPILHGKTQISRYILSRPKAAGQNIFVPADILSLYGGVVTNKNREAASDQKNALIIRKIGRFLRNGKGGNEAG